MRSPNYPAGTRPFIPLFWRLSVPNATVLAVGSIILLVAPAGGRLLVLVAGLAALLVINVLLMLRAFAALSKLTTLIERLSARTGLVVERVLERHLPRLAPDAGPVIYRVAQESLTNVIRHAQGDLRFMRERAISVGADLQITARGSSGGTEVRLRVADEGMPR